MAVVLDSGAVIGFLDRGDSLHGSADMTIRRLIAEHSLLVSVVTYAEVLTGARLGRHDESQVRGFFRQLISAVLPIDLPIADRAADLRAGLRSLRMPDALILATAEITPDADLIVTGDATASKVPELRCPVELLV